MHIRIPGWSKGIPGWVLKRHYWRVFGGISERVLPAGIPEESAGGFSWIVLGGISGEVPEKVSEEIPARISEDFLEEFLEDLLQIFWRNFWWNLYWNSWRNRRGNSGGFRGKTSRFLEESLKKIWRYSKWIPWRTLGVTAAVIPEENTEKNLEQSQRRTTGYRSN